MLNIKEGRRPASHVPCALGVCGAYAQMPSANNGERGRERERGRGEGGEDKLGALASKSDILPLPPIPSHCATSLSSHRIGCCVWVRSVRNTLCGRIVKKAV